MHPTSRLGNWAAGPDSVLVVVFMTLLTQHRVSSFSYGNHCGEGHGIGEGSPSACAEKLTVPFDEGQYNRLMGACPAVDKTDGCCADHDLCWWKKGSRACECETELLDCLASHSHESKSVEEANVFLKVHEFADGNLRGYGMLEGNMFPQVLSMSYWADDEDLGCYCAAGWEQHAIYTKKCGAPCLMDSGEWGWRLASGSCWAFKGDCYGVPELYECGGRFVDLVDCWEDKSIGYYYPKYFAPWETTQCHRCPVCYYTDVINARHSSGVDQTRKVTPFLENNGICKKCPYGRCNAGGGQGIESCVYDAQAAEKQAASQSTYTRPIMLNGGETQSKPATTYMAASIVIIAQIYLVDLV